MHNFIHNITEVIGPIHQTSISYIRNIRDFWWYQVLFWLVAGRPSWDLVWTVLYRTAWSIWPITRRVQRPRQVQFPSKWKGFFFGFITAFFLLRLLDSVRVPTRLSRLHAHFFFLLLPPFLVEWSVVTFTTFYCLTLFHWIWIAEGGGGGVRGR